MSKLVLCEGWIKQTIKAKGTTEVYIVLTSTHLKIYQSEKIYKQNSESFIKILDLSEDFKVLPNPFEGSLSFSLFKKGERAVDRLYLEAVDQHDYDLWVFQLEDAINKSKKPIALNNSSSSIIFSSNGAKDLDKRPVSPRIQKTTYKVINNSPTHFGSENSDKTKDETKLLKKDDLVDKNAKLGDLKASKESSNEVQHQVVQQSVKNTSLKKSQNLQPNEDRILKEENQNLVKETRQQKETNKKLQDDLNKLSTSSVDECKKLQNETDSLKGEPQTFSYLIRAHEGEINSLKESVNKLTKENTKLEVAITDLKKSSNSKLEENKKLKDENQNLIKESRQQKETNKRLQDEINGLKKLSTNNSNDECKKLQKEIESLKAEVKTFIDLKLTHEGEMNLLKESVNKLTKENTQLEEEIIVMNREYSHLENESKLVNEKLKSSTLKINEETGSNVKLKAELGHLKKEATDLKHQNKTLQNKVDTLQKENEILSSSFKSCKEELEALKTEIGDQMKRNNLLSDEIDFMKNDKSLNSENDKKFENEISQLKDKLKIAENEKKTFNSKLKANESVITSHKNESKHLMSEKENLLVEKQELLKQIAELEKSNQSKNEILDRQYEKLVGCFAEPSQHKNFLNYSYRRCVDYMFFDDKNLSFLKSLLNDLLEIVIYNCHTDLCSDVCLYELLRNNLLFSNESIVCFIMNLISVFIAQLTNCKNSTPFPSFTAEIQRILSSNIVGNRSNFTSSLRETLTEISYLILKSNDTSVSLMNGFVESQPVISDSSNQIVTDIIDDVTFKKLFLSQLSKELDKKYQIAFGQVKKSDQFVPSESTACYSESQSPLQSYVIKKVKEMSLELQKKDLEISDLYSTLSMMSEKINSSNQDDGLTLNLESFLNQYALHSEILCEPCQAKAVQLFDNPITQKIDVLVFNLSEFWKDIVDIQKTLATKQYQFTLKQVNDKLNNLIELFENQMAILQEVTHRKIVNPLVHEI